MSIEQNKATVRRYFEAMNAVYETGDFSPLDGLIAPDYVYHAETGDLRGIEGMRELVSAYRAAFPDVRFTVEDIVAEGDRVVVRFTAVGTQRGESISVSVIDLLRLRDGQIVEDWERFDLLNMLTQLGATPTFTNPVEA
jgi:ketosteroid isomerase-like protein